MADISNRLQEQDYGAGRYSHSGDPKSMANTVVGDTLSGIASIGEAGIVAADKAIIKNIESDLFNELDKADAELGITQDTSAEASIDLPSAITNPMNQMANAKEAVNQGRMTETQFYNRMDSVVRQLRVKYPGYRNEIDKLSGQIIGFDTANAVRKQQFAQASESTKTAAATVKADRTLLDNVVKAGVPMTPALEEANRLLSQGIPLPDDLRQDINFTYLTAVSTNSQIANQKAVFEVEDKSFEANQRDISVLENSAINASRQIITKLSIARGGATTIEQLRAKFMEDNELSREEALILRSEIERMKVLAKQSSDGFYNTPIEGSDLTFGYFMPKEKRQYDGGLSIINDIEKSIFGEDTSDAAFSKNLVDMQSSQVALSLMQDNEIATLRGLKDLLGPEAFMAVQGRITGIVNRTLSNKLIVGGSKGKSAAATLQDVVDNGLPVSSKEATDAFLSLKEIIVNGNKNSPKEAYKQFKALFGATRSGEHNLNTWAPSDRLKIYQKIADPEFSDWIRKNGSPEMQSEYSDWLFGAFKATFREDTMNVAALSEEDITGYQLTFNPQKGFEFTGEGYGAEVASNIMQTTTGNIGVTRWTGSINTVNSFLTTYMNSLPEDISDEDKAKQVTAMVESLGISSEPSAAGGFWFKLVNAITSWEGGRANDNKKQAAPKQPNVGDQSSLIPDNVQVQPASDTMTMSEFAQQQSGIVYSNVKGQPNPRETIDTIRTIVGEARGEPEQGQQAIVEVVRNRSIATGKPMNEIVRAGNGSQFNAWKPSDPNYRVTSTFSENSEGYGNYKQVYDAGLSSDITGGATHYYNPSTSNPDWAQGGNFVETARIGNHRFGYLKNGDIYRKKLMDKIGEGNNA